MSADPQTPASQPVVALCDPTPAATNAAWRAAFVARELGTHLVLLHVAPRAERAEASHQVLAGLAGRIRERMGIDVQSQALGGDPLREAVRAAAEARMIVVGPSKANPLRDFIAGTQAERLIRLCRAPVLVVKRSATSAYRRLLVPLDFRQEGSQAVALAASLSRAPRLEMFHAIASRASRSGAAGDEDAALQAQRQAMSRSALQRLDEFAEAGGAGDEAIAKVAFGEAADLIVSRAHATRADVIVIGKRPRGMLASFLLGNVTQRVLAHARTDVLVLPRGSEPAPAPRPQPQPAMQGS